MKLHKAIAAARKAKGISLRELERLTGIGNSGLSQIETGWVKEPSFSTVVKISRALGVPLEDWAETV
jgi:transcriptional regulator with XRE-family HTH domain